MTALASVELQIDDFINCDWGKIINDTEIKDCKNYYDSFFQEAKNFTDEKPWAVLTLLGAVTSMRLVPESDAIYSPCYDFGNMRGFILEDLSENHIEVLSAFLDFVEDAELKSRIADIVWIIGRSPYFKVVPIAISAYIESAINLLKPETSFRGIQYTHKAVERFHRALDLGLETNQKELINEIIDAINSILIETDKDNLDFPFIGLIRILFKYRNSVEAQKCIELCEELISESESQRKWFDKVKFLSLKADWELFSGDNIANRQSLIECSETYQKIAESYAHSPQPNYSAAEMYLRFAIEQLRKLGGMQDRTKELHSAIVQYQNLSAKDIKMHSFPIDVGDAPDKVMNEFSNLEWNEAVIKLGTFIQPIILSETRKRVEEYLFDDDFSFQYLFSIQIIGANNRPKAQVPSLIGASKEDTEIAIQYRIHQEVGRSFHLYAIAMIMPAIQQLNKDHYINLMNWEFLVTNNLFVPDDRKLLYMKGLQAGFKGDYITALHILIPQLENSLRYILEIEGFQPYSIDTTTGINQAHTLETLLEETPLLKEIMGEDIIFSLKTLLTRKFGSNYRNEMAHGLMSSSHFFDPKIIYLWWLILYLLVVGLPKSGNSNHEK